MKLSFSTVGCPNWMLNEVLAAASDFGYDGIELRGIGEDLFLPRANVFGPKRMETSLREIRRSGLEVACLATDASCMISSDSPDVQQNLMEYVDLGIKIGARTLRILGDEWDTPGSAVDLALAAQNLYKIADYANGKPILLLVETNGVFADTKTLRALIEQVGSAQIGALWDIHHPYSYFGETPEQTMDNIGRHIGHVHVKDSIRSAGKPTYKMLGHGDLPIKEFLRLLQNSGYQGYLSLEWVKRWNQDLEDAGIVFPHYIRKMRKLLEEK